MQLKGARVLVAGHTGLVGAALVRRLIQEGANILGCNTSVCDLRRQRPTELLFERFRPDVVFLVAATVGGIEANRRRPAEFAYNNLTIVINTIEAARISGIKKFVFLGSSCIYPRDAEQPITEDALLTGPLEETNRAYAVAKIAGVELCRAYRQQHGMDAISIMPPNVYGEGDHFEGRDTHVLAALVSRIVAAKRDGQRTVTIWGSGKPVREFLHTDDLADALCLLASTYSEPTPINVGWGTGISIMDLALMIGRVVGWDGVIITDPSMPDGHPIKVMDCSRMTALGWRPKITLEEGIRRVVAAYGARQTVAISQRADTHECIDSLGTWMTEDNVPKLHA